MHIGMMSTYHEQHTTINHHDYFMEADSDSVDEAFVELKEDDVTVEEIQLMRIKFLSENPN